MHGPTGIFWANLTPLSLKPTYTWDVHANFVEAEAFALVQKLTVLAPLRGLGLGRIAERK
jgi:hypothetical protein